MAFSGAAISRRRGAAICKRRGAATVKGAATDFFEVVERAATAFFAVVRLLMRDFLVIDMGIVLCPQILSAAAAQSLRRFICCMRRAKVEVDYPNCGLRVFSMVCSVCRTIRTKVCA